MRYISLLLPLLGITLASCSQHRKVETSDGVTTERYTVDKENRRDGEYRRYFGGDTLGEVSYYEHGRLQGNRTIYNKQGNPEIVETYVDDTLNGPYTVYDTSGDVTVYGVYDHGVMRGVWNRYYPGHKILEKVTYENNLENGPFTEYYENGNLKAKGKYLEGDYEQDSLWLYNDAGTLARIMICDNGICHTIWLNDTIANDSAK